MKKYTVLTAAALVCSLATIAHATPLSPEHKQLLTQTMQASCMKGMEGQPNTAAMKEKLGADFASRYCGCASARTSEVVTQEDVAQIAQNKGAPPPHIQQRMQESAAYCIQQLASGKAL